MASLKSLNRLLIKASRSLDEAARQIRDLGLQPRKNNRRIGEMLITRGSHLTPGEGAPSLPASGRQHAAARTEEST